MKAMIFRGWKAIGDLLYSSQIPRLLKENGYDVVHFACWEENQAVLWNNPFLDEIKIFPRYMSAQTFNNFLQDCLDNYDAIFDLRFSIENRFLFRTDGDVPSLEERRKINQGVNYFEETVKITTYEKNVDKFRPEIYMTQEEIERIIQLKKKFPKVVFWQFYGSSNAKLLIRAPLWLNAISERVPDAMHIIIGDAPFSVHRLCGNEKVINTAGQWTLRTVLCSNSIANLVIGPESMLINASGAFNVPKIVCYSGTVHENLTRDFENVYPFYPTCECHPCYLISISPKGVWNLEKRKQAWEYEMACRVPDPFQCYRYLGFKCALSLPEQELIDKAVEILNKPSPPIEIKKYLGPNKYETVKLEFD